MEEIKDLKTFADLIPGDNVYVIDFKKELKIPEEPGDFPSILSVHKVSKIFISDVGSIVMELKGHSEDVKFSTETLKTPVQYVNVGTASRYAPHNIEFKNFVYFVDERNLFDVCQSAALSLLLKQDADKADCLKRHEERKAKIRNVFYEYLRNEKH